jgi:hypothetical protein
MLALVPWTLWQQIELIMFVVALPKEPRQIQLMNIYVLVAVAGFSI